MESSVRDGGTYLSAWDASTTARIPPYLLSLLFPTAVVAGNIVGGWTTGAGVILAFVIYPLCDAGFGKDDRRPHAPLSPRMADSILIAQAVMHLAAITTLILLVRSGAEFIHIALAVISTGVNSGLSMIVSAHEFIHRRSRILRGLGLFLLWTVGYLHFQIEHEGRHHHVYSSKRDPATAGVNESYWDHLPKTVILQLIDAWSHEKAVERGGLRNRVLLYGMITMLTWFAIHWLLGSAVLAVWVLQGVLGIAALEYANFIFHWGLEHDEEVEEADSWQILNRWSRWVTLRHTYHADHHLHPHKRCYELTARTNSPTLPSGFFGCLYLAGLPPLWLAVMQDRLPFELRPRSISAEGTGVVE